MRKPRMDINPASYTFDYSLHAYYIYSIVSRGLILCETELLLENENSYNITHLLVRGSIFNFYGICEFMTVCR